MDFLLPVAKPARPMDHDCCIFGTFVKCDMTRRHRIGRYVIEVTDFKSKVNFDPHGRLEAAMTS